MRALARCGAEPQRLRAGLLRFSAAEIPCGTPQALQAVRSEAEEVHVAATCQTICILVHAVAAAFLGCHNLTPVSLRPPVQVL